MLFRSKETFREDQEKVVEKATRAWTLVRNRFKSGSPAESIIKPTEYEGALNELWSTFLKQYDDRTTKRGALEIMRKFFENDIKYNSDVVAHFLFLQKTL